MSHSVKFWLVQLLLGGVLLAGIFCIALQPGAQERQSITENDVWQRRPANMFKMSENNDPTVCDPLLASLNEEKDIADRRAHPIIQNEFIIYPWRQQEYSWTNASNDTSWTGSRELAHLDLDRDGVKDGLFRETNRIKFHPYHADWFVRSIDSNIVSNESLAETAFRNIAKSENGIYLKGTHGNEKFGRIFLEIITIQRQNYLLLFSAFYWSLKTESRFPIVHVVKRNTAQFRQICRFDGIVEVERGPRF